MFILIGNEPTTTKEAEIITNGRNSGKIISFCAFRERNSAGAEKNGLGWFSFPPKHFQGFFKRLLLEAMLIERTKDIMGRI